MALQAGSLAQPAGRETSPRACAAAPASLSCVRHAGGRRCQPLPSVRREYDVFGRRGQPFARPAAAANFSGELRHSESVLRALRREPAGYHAFERRCGAHRRTRRDHESWRHRRPDSPAHGRVPASSLRSRAAVAAHHSDLPARQPAAHRLQYVGADGRRADHRGSLRLGAVSIHVYRDGRFRICRKRDVRTMSASALPEHCSA